MNEKSKIHETFFMAPSYCHLDPSPVDPPLNSSLLQQHSGRKAPRQVLVFLDGLRSRPRLLQNVSRQPDRSRQPQLLHDRRPTRRRTHSPRPCKSQSLTASPFPISRLRNTRRNLSIFMRLELSNARPSSQETSPLVPDLDPGEKDDLRGPPGVEEPDQHPSLLRRRRGNLLRG